MRKQLVRILALVLCAVIVLGMIPMIALATEIQPRSIMQDGDIYYFQTFEDLKELSQTCEEYATLAYAGQEELVISEDIQFPAKVVLESATRPVRVAENASLKISYVYVDSFTVDGEAVCYEVLVNTLLAVSGTLTYEGRVVLFEGAQLLGLENVQVLDPENPYASIAIGKNVHTMAELLETVAMAEDMMSNSRVIMDLNFVSYDNGNNTYTDFVITESVKMPANCKISMFADVTIDAGCTLDAAYIDVYEYFYVNGTVRSDYLRCTDADRGQLRVAEGGQVDVDWIDLEAWDVTDLALLLPGMDLSNYEVTRMDISERGVDYWELEKVSDPVPSVMPGDMDGDGMLDDQDVAYLLWHTLFPETYEITGNADFTGDGKVDDEDVAYLLWHTLFPENYPLN